MRSVVSTRRRIMAALAVGQAFLMRWGAATAVAGALIGTMPSVVAAQRGRSELNDGNRLYEEGRFGEAHEKYLEALRDAPELPLALFNDGNALYQTEEYERALDAYRRAIEAGDPALAAPAWYNLGNSLYRQQKFQQSLEAYKQALRIDPGEIDFKHNLERVLEQLQQQEQQSGDGDSDQQNQDQNQDQQNPEGEQEQDPNEDPNQGQQPDESPEEEQSESGQQPDPAPGEMTQEEAERLLQAVQEDPSEVNGRRAPLRGRRPRKPW